MTKEEIQAGLKKHGPFSYVIDLPYGLKTPVSTSYKPNDIPFIRVNSFVNYAFPSILKACGNLEKKLILDIGCNCGHFSFEIAKKNVGMIIGIDTYAKYIDQAFFLREVFNDQYNSESKVDFILTDIEDPTFIPPSDITFCFGLLYHFTNPVKVMQYIANLTKDILIVDTDIFSNSNKSKWIMKIRKVPWYEKEVCEMLPTELAVTDLLKFIGFPNIEKIKPKQSIEDKRYLKGSRVTYIAKK